MIRGVEGIGLLEDAGWKAAEIAQCISVSAKQLYYLKRQMVVPNRELDIELTLGTALFNHKTVEFPWALEAHRKIIVIRNLFRNGQITKLYSDEGFAVQVFFEDLQSLEANNFEFGGNLWSKALASFFFIASMRHSRQSFYTKIYSQDDLVLVTGILIRLIGTIPRHSWVVVLESIIHQIFLAEKWNKAGSASGERCSEQMRLWLEATNMRDCLIEYNDLVPFAYEAPFSALAIASRFKEREVYVDLLERIMRAKRLKSLYAAAEAVLKDKDADEDFDDFRCWLAENRDALKRKKAA